MTPLADYFKSLPVLDMETPWVDGPTLMDGHLLTDRHLSFGRDGVLFIPWDAVISYCSFRSRDNSTGGQTLVFLPKKLSREVFGKRPDDVAEIARSMIERRWTLG